MSHEDNYADLETIKFLVDELVVKEKTIVIAAIIARLQRDYLDVATLSTDGEYDPTIWSHSDVMDFITKGSIE